MADTLDKALTVTMMAVCFFISFSAPYFFDYPYQARTLGFAGAFGFLYFGLKFWIKAARG